MFIQKSLLCTDSYYLFLCRRSCVNNEKKSNPTADETKECQEYNTLLKFEPLEREKNKQLYLARSACAGEHQLTREKCVWFITWHIAS